LKQTTVVEFLDEILNLNQILVTGSG